MGTDRRLRVLGRTGKDFTENISIHGFAYWIDSGRMKLHNIFPSTLCSKFSNSDSKRLNTLERLFWVVVTILSFVASARILYDAVVTWNAMPTGLA